MPRVDAAYGKAVLDAVYRAIQAKTVVACHDLSEGGLGAAAAEMAIGGRLGCQIDIAKVTVDGVTRPEEILFSESQSRLLLEVPPDRLTDLRANLAGVDFAEIGTVTGTNSMRITNGGSDVAKIEVADLVYAFKHPLDLDHTMTDGTTMNEGASN